MIRHGWVINGTKKEAKEQYDNKMFVYELSNTHRLLVQVLETIVYGGVVMCRIKPVDVLKVWSKSKDKTDYASMEGELVLAGRLTSL